jgi:hypothetical protein
VELPDLLRWLSAFGYSPPFAKAALGKLLNRGLVFSPESETKLSLARNVKISPSGQLYIDQLLRNGQYLINAVYDVPLPHALWTRDSKGFESKLSSIHELATTVFAQEVIELERLISFESDVAPLGSVVHCGLLTRHIVPSARTLIEDAFYTRSPRARAAADKYTELFQSLEGKLDGEQKLSEELIRRRAHAPEQENAEIMAEIGEFGEIRLEVPKHMGPADQNLVNVYLRLDQDIPNKLTVYWQSICDEKCNELTLIERNADDRWHHGTFTISNLVETHAFPPSRVTVFADANPIIVKTLDAPV